MNEPQQPTPETTAAAAAVLARANSKYTADDLKHLSDLEHVRTRFGMYIGDNTARGLHHLVFEVVDNSIDEALAGYATSVQVTINNDGSVTVEDDGRGIPVETHPDLSASMGREISTLEGVMTVLKFGGKFDKGAYQTSGGLHGVGVTVVNFLSHWCEVEVCRDGHVYQQEYERGVPLGPVQQIGATTKRGTKTTFSPDGSIFQVTKFSYNTLHKRLQDLAFLNRGVRITIRDEQTGEHAEFCYERGIVEFVEHLNGSSDPAHPEVVYLEGEQDGVGFEIAFQYTAEYTENVHSYVNNIHTVEGGTHVSGFRAALTRVLNSYGKKEGYFKENATPQGEDFREGITAVISLRVPHPQFEGQTKTKLGNNEVEGIIASALGEFLTRFLEENPKVAKAIIMKGVLAMQAREAARKAKDLLRERKGALGGGGLPGKLRDCISREVHRCELYLVEGLSAGGTAEAARDKDFQAVLPLRGKLINAFKARDDKVLSNEEVRSMIQAIGIGIGEEQNLEKRRYDKIIIMADADVDGSHIRTLLLCFFYRQMHDLVRNGHVYVAQPPLFRVVQGKKSNYVQTEEEMRTILLERGLHEAEFDPDTGRTYAGAELERLCRVLGQIEDALVAIDRSTVGLKLLAEQKDPATGRLPMFHVRLGVEEHWCANRQALNELLARSRPAGGELTVKNGEQGPNGAEGESVRITELHEVRTVNAGLGDLADLGFGVEALFPEDRTGKEKPRYVLRRGEQEIPLQDLRGLLAAIRSAGEKGLQITRFKGLGEMMEEELRDTTMDPQYRRLVRVTMEDLAEADLMFRTLMGDKVEPRRAFIEKHALEVRNLDV